MEYIYNFISKKFPAYFHIPTNVDLRYRRWMALANIGYPLCIVIHICYLFVFFNLNLDFLFYFNFLSCAIFLSCIYLSKRGYYYAGFVLACLEVFTHSSLCIYFLGWESGFHYLIFASTACVYLAPPGQYMFKFLVFSSNSLGYVYLHYWAHTNNHMIMYRPAVVYWFSIANILTLFFVLAIWGFAYSVAATRVEEALDYEHQRSEKLLYNVLPAEIAKKLKVFGGTIADMYPSASVMFIDLVNFSELAKRLGPVKLVDILNDIFSQIDDVVERHGLEKIKTIGDSYMVSAGVPNLRHDHAVAMAEMALDVMETFKHIMLDNGEKIQIRIGISSGEVIAGVIGKKRFIYDLWGDSVNMASRMEATGQPGKIQVSETTYRHLVNHYVMEKRDAIYVKGKGLITTYFLLERRSSLKVNKVS